LRLLKQIRLKIAKNCRFLDQSSFWKNVTGYDLILKKNSPKNVKFLSQKAIFYFLQ
jgi:hypothetical protein